MGLGRGMIPIKAEADAALSGLMIADIGVGDAVGIGKREEFIPVEFRIVTVCPLRS